MKLVTTTDLLTRKTDAKTAVSMIKEAGFDGIDLSMFYMMYHSDPLGGDQYADYVKELRAYADSLSIGFEQGHSPFPSYDAANASYTERIVPYIQRSIEIAGMLGIKYLVIHPISPVQKPQDADLKQFNISFYRSLLPYAKEYGVTVCLENMWGYDEPNKRIVPNVCSLGKDLADYVDALDSPYIAACLDLGHCGLVGEDAAEAIRALGRDRLKALHVHDNNFRADQHLLPYLGQMNWESITSALKEIRYTGNLTFEADATFVGLPSDRSLLSSAWQYMESVGRYLIKKVEE